MSADDTVMASAIGESVARYARLKEQERVLKHQIDEVAETLGGLLNQGGIVEASVEYDGMLYDVKYKATKPFMGHLVTADMVGTYVGGKAGSRPLVVRVIGKVEP